MVKKLLLEIFHDAITTKISPLSFSLSLSLSFTIFLFLSLSLHRRFMLINTILSIPFYQILKWLVS